MIRSSNPSQRPTTITKKIIASIKNQVQIGNDFKLSLYAWTKIGTVKSMISKETNIAVSDMVLVFKNFPLARPYKDVEEYGIRNQSVIHLERKHHLEKNRFQLTSYNILDDGGQAESRYKEAKWEVEAGLNAGLIPKLTDFGSSGTYLLQNVDKKPVAIFKAQDEEPFAPNNPRGYPGKFSTPGLRSGVLSGESVDREVFAFLLDQVVGGYHSVPVTTFVDFSHPSFKSNEHLVYHGDTQTVEVFTESIPKKRGSFQVFVNHHDNVGDYGSSLFSIEQVQKIAILDMRILNCDRNEENILVKKKKIEIGKGKTSYDFFLIPIDHGYSMPDNFNICQDEVIINHLQSIINKIVWFHWDQIKQPLTLNAIECLKNIDPVKDVKLLRSKLKMREICLRNFRIAETTLIACFKKGLNLYQIAQLMFRSDPDLISPLEKEVQRAEEYYQQNLPIPNAVNGFQLKNQLNLSKSSHSEKKEKEENITLQGFDATTLQQNFNLNLKIIKEEEIIQIDESNGSNKKNGKNFPDVHEQVPDSPVKVGLKRSISQPIILMSNFQSALNDKSKQKPIYSEKFFKYFEVFLQNMIEAKLNENVKGGRRQRYKSEDIF